MPSRNLVVDVASKLDRSFQEIKNCTLLEFNLVFGAGEEEAVNLIRLFYDLIVDIFDLGCLTLDSSSQGDQPLDVLDEIIDLA